MEHVKRDASGSLYEFRGSAEAVAECNGASLDAMTRAFLNEKPKSDWPDAVVCAVKNRLP